MKRIVNQSHDDFNKIQAESESGVSIEILEYDRGFSSTRVKWKLDLGKYQSFFGIEDIVVVEDAKHGYTSVVSKSSLAENKWYAETAIKNIESKDPLHISTKYTMFGDAVSTIALDAFSAKDGDRLLTSKPGKLVITAGNGFNTFSYQGYYGGLAVQNEFHFEDFTFQAEGKKISAHTWTGKGSVAIAKLEADNKRDHIKASNIKFGYSLDHEKENNTVSMGADYSVSEFISKETSIEDASLHIAMNNIDIDGYDELMAVYSQMVTSTMDDLSQDQEAARMRRARAQQRAANEKLQLIAAFEKMLKSGLELKISELKATIPEGEINADITLALKNDLTMAQLLPIASQPKLALDIFSLKSDVSLPADLVGNNPRMFVPFYPGMQTGLFVEDGESVVHKAETRDGKLYLNGEEFLLD